MLRKILCTIVASIVIVSGCCWMIVQSKLTDFTETNENGVIRIYNTNEDFVKEQVNSYKKANLSLLKTI